MKVNIYETVQVDDAQRKQIASVIDQKDGKRAATRDELKSFIWANGEDWPIVLSDHYAELTGQAASNDADVPETDGEDADEDLEDLL